MPRVAQVDGATINVYFADHNPPHFHAREAGAQALITIRDLTVLRGAVPSLPAVLAWAEENRETLIAAWNTCNPDKPY
ncbi:MAG: DUF4160 domain-containing protein [Labilithrix sp.]|nr:DUF4160 domain-containing protein [Labilithrix sp.]